MAIITGLLGTTLLNRFLEGGALFMSLILICFLLSIYFTVIGFVNIKTNPTIFKNMLKLINDSSILGLTLGFLGGYLGIISGFDAIEASGNAEPAILAGGIKVGLLSPLFGLFTPSRSTSLTPASLKAKNPLQRTAEPVCLSCRVP